jgi:uncharacterized protein YkwD
LYHGRRSRNAALAREASGRVQHFSLLFSLACALSCGTRPAPPAHGPKTEPAAEAPGPYSWQPETRSPRPAEPPSADLGARCRRGDLALERVAALVAERELGGSPVDLPELGFALRAEGSPYVWPRLYTLAGPRGLPEASDKVPAWLALGDEGGELRCGIARRVGDREVLAAVAVSVLADLEPVPTSVRPGTWVTVDARLLVPAQAASVLVLGPRGAARRVPTSFGGSRVTARFSADHEGAWLVQVLATVEGGPRPVAEAVVHVGASPPTRFASAPVPGEESGGDADPGTSLLAMVNAARRAEGLSPVRADPALMELATRHASAMRDAQRLAHDIGQGTPDQRAERAGLVPKALGENVAHAMDVRGAHRTLWASPSHRGNLLDPRFDSVGIGTAIGEDGTLWVCEVFGRLR